MDARLDSELPPFSAPSKYVQQLFQYEESAAPDNTVLQELRQLKAQITDAAATLEFERQAYQRARVGSSAPTCWSHIQARTSS